jgi:hypothetical protein
MNPLDHRRQTAVLVMRRAKRVDGGRGRFWVFAALLGLFYMAASAPSPLYADYAARWQHRRRDTRLPCERLRGHVVTSAQRLC